MVGCSIDCGDTPQLHVSMLSLAWTPWPLAMVAIDSRWDDAFCSHIPNPKYCDVLVAANCCSAAVGILRVVVSTTLQLVLVFGVSLP